MDALLTTAIVMFLTSEDGGLRAITQTSSSAQSITVTEGFTEQSSSNVIAPGAVELEATAWAGFDSSAPSGNDYDERLHNIEYFWSITGPGDFSARSDLNVPSSPAVFRDLSKQRGPHVLFPVTTAGSYTWTLFAVEMTSGKTTTETGSFTAVSEASAFPTTQTICYSPDNNFTDAPSGSQQITTLAALNTAIDAATSPFRILLRRGETYAGSDMALTIPSDFPNFRSGTYQSGADPVVSAPFTGSFFEYPSGSTGQKHVWVGPLSWEGRWDSANERGYVDDVKAVDCNGATGTLVMYGVTTDGITNPWNASLAADSLVAYVSCSATNWSGFGMLNGTSGNNTNRRLAFIGSALFDPAGTVDGDFGRKGSGEYEGGLCHGAPSNGWAIRIANYPTIILQHCEMVNTKGYLSDTYPFHQPVFRANTDNLSGIFNSIAYCVFEGGTDIIALNGVDGTVQNILVDSNLFVASGATQSFIKTGPTGLTFRNNMFLCFTTRQVHTSVNGPNVLARSNDTSNVPVWHFNNTSFLNRDEFYSETILWTNYVNATSENNIKRDSADTDITLETIAGYTPRYDGLKPGFPIIPHTLGSTWTNTGTFTISYPDSGTYYNETTNQAYWTPIAGTDTQHVIKLNDGSYLYAADGDFSVSYDASVITFTNNTGGDISAQAISIKLDRASKLTVDTRFASDASGSLGWPKIASGSEASFEISTGLESYRDLENTDRGATAYQGAIEAV